MKRTIVEISIIAKREVPKIAGSAAAFIALVIILVLIIIVSCTAVVYLLREERAHDAEGLTYRARGRHDPGSRANYSLAPKKWYTRILDISGSNYQDKPETSRLDTPKSKPGRRSKGWLQAGNGSDWDSDSGGEQSPRNQPKNTLAPSSTRMKGYYDPSINTKRSTTAGTSPQSSRVNSFNSNLSTSTVHFDPHGVRGLSYPDVYAPSPQRTIPSIQSQLYTSSPPQSPSPSIQPNRILSTSPVQIESSLSIDSVHGASRSLSTNSGPSIRTFEGGTKFIEGL